MIRRAVIVGSPGSGAPGDRFLPGVQLDLASYESFLRSDNGGAWEASEITVLHKPTRSDVLAALAVARAARPEYSVTIFSGHGWHRNKSSEIFIRADEPPLLAVQDFCVGLGKELSIFDACQGLAPEQRKMAEDHREHVGAGRPPDPYRAACRALYDSQIRFGPDMRAIMWACSVEENALEIGQGGLFTVSVLGHARDWAHSVRSVNQFRATTSMYLDLGDAFAPAKKAVLEATLRRQTPELWDPKSRYGFPFAVA